VAILEKVDEEAKELLKRTCPIAFQQHISDNFYVTVTSRDMYVELRRYSALPVRLLYLVQDVKVPGITLRLDEWAEMVTLILTIHARFPSLATAKCCIDTGHPSNRCHSFLYGDKTCLV